MAFRPPKKPPQFADLKGILSQGKDTDSAIYQTIQVLIERLDQLKDHTQDQITNITKSDDFLKNIASKFATYHTKEDETTKLPNSVQLLAGTGIIFDDSVVNKRTIKSTGGSSHYDCPLSDGDVNEADLIYANGECVIVQVPV